jgi:hypothetical protein
MHQISDTVIYGIYIHVDWGMSIMRIMLCPSLHIFNGFR